MDEHQTDEANHQTEDEKYAKLVALRVGPQVQGNNKKGDHAAHAVAGVLNGEVTASDGVGDQAGNPGEPAAAGDAPNKVEEK